VERQERVQGPDQVQGSQSQDDEQLIERVAALDIGKAMLVCCSRVPGEDGKRPQQVSEHSTMTRSLGLLAEQLLERGVTRVVMEATGD
jgi:transposase